MKCSNSKYKQKAPKESVKRHSRNVMQTAENHSIKSKNDTSLSIEYWTLKQKQQSPRLTWKIRGQYKAYNLTLKKL